MKAFLKTNLVAVIGLAFLVTFTFNQSLSAQKNKKEIKQEAIKLAYSFPSGIPVKYLTNSKVIQKIDINGQIMETDVNSILGCTVKLTGNKEDNLLLEVTIDTVGQKIDSPMGPQERAFPDAKGKFFNMTLSKLGKEVDVTEAQSIVFTVEGEASSNAMESFSDFFPDLPEGPMDQGYTWTTNDTVNSKSGNAEVMMTVKAENKFEGFEMAGDINCARISAVISGIREIKTQTQGMDVKVSGPYDGTVIMLFSQEKGCFIKQTVDTKMSGMVEITSPESMSLPIEMDMSSVSEVVK
jgi:hypothetical protein